MEPAHEKERDETNSLLQRLSNIPCFRNSYLYGIMTGIGAGLTYFMFTSRIRRSTNVALGVYVVSTLGYWTYCRYSYEKNLKMMKLMKEFLNDKIEKEGTSLDAESVRVYDVVDNTGASTV